ncbi:Magnesium transporter MgtE [Hydrogenovibrio crunogenus]|uniref:Magnesium transporter MgtE n=1 Tax=Hydrogenovibrio crunogenus TaxID=39765 RepID=A0A4V1C8T2_9GAMM|nr:magnesium transporter [Hydrogenovibrio crunogenus]QBZ82994.1 Magnesium transporter MgtE [Hydrogenovibrio crunogenus]
MSQIHHTIDKLQITEQLHKAVSEQNTDYIQQLLQGLVAEEVAEILEATPPKERSQLWGLLPSDTQGEILGHTNDEVRANLLSHLDQHEIIQLTEALETDDIADIIQSLPDEEKSSLLAKLPEQNRRAVQTALSYPEDTAGGLMSTDFIAVRSDVTLEVVIRLLRKIGSLPKDMVDLIVRDRDGKYQGTLKLNELLVHDEETLVADLVDPKRFAIKALVPDKEVATIFEKNDLISIAVVDENNFVLGRITIDDVVDIIREEAERAQMASAGLDDEEDLFAPPLRSAKRRSFWLGINLLTAIFASIVIGFFEATIEQVVALAVLMPIIASMGGIAGTQTATIVIRAIATGKLGAKNSHKLILKETAVGSFNGLLWAILTSVVTWFWFQDSALGIIFGAAMLINLVAAAFAGALIPLFLNKIKVDPALASGLMLTTVTDSLGFFVFLGLATIVFTI